MEERPWTTKTERRPVSAQYEMRPTTSQVPRMTRPFSGQKRPPKYKQTKGLPPHAKGMGRGGTEKIPSIFKSAHQLRIAMPFSMNVDISSKHWDIVSNQTEQRLGKQLPVRVKSSRPLTAGDKVKIHMESFHSLDSRRSSGDINEEDEFPPPPGGIPFQGGEDFPGLEPILEKKPSKSKGLDFPYQKPFSFLSNLGGKETSSRLLSPRSKEFTGFGFIGGASEGRSGPGRITKKKGEDVENQFVTANIDVEGSSKQRELTIFTNSDVDDFKHSKGMTRKPSKPTTAPGGKRPGSGRRPQTTKPPSTGQGKGGRGVILGRPMSSYHLSKQGPQLTRIQSATARNRPMSAVNVGGKMSRPLTGQRAPVTGKPKEGTKEDLKAAGLYFGEEDIGDGDLGIQEISQESDDRFPPEERFDKYEFENAENIAYQRTTDQLLKSRPTTATLFKKEREDLPYPDVFDRAERTLAATFAKFGDLSYHTPVQRIAKYYQYSARLKKKHLMDIIAYLKTTSKKLKKGEEDDETDDFIDNCLFHGLMQDEHPLKSQKESIGGSMEEREETPTCYDPGAIKLEESSIYLKGWTPELRKEVDMSEHRYHHYLQTEEIRTEELSKYKKRWMTNALTLIGDDNLLRDFEEIVRRLYQEIFQNYGLGMRKAIMDYILISPDERKRLHILVLPRPILSSSHKMVIGGGYSKIKFNQWHLHKMAAQEEIKLRLLSNNIVISSLHSWIYDFRWINLMYLENFSQYAYIGHSLPIKTFLKLQRNYLKKAVTLYKDFWHRGAILIIRKFKFMKFRGTRNGKFTFAGYSETNTHKEKVEYENTNTEFQKNGLPKMLNVIKGGNIFRQREQFYKDFGFESSIPNEIIEISLDDLTDIRENPAYVGFVSLIGGFINFAENGYSILAKEYKKEIKYSAGNLMKLQLRGVIERNVNIIENFFLSFETLDQIKEALPDMEKKKIRERRNNLLRKFEERAKIIEENKQMEEIKRQPSAELRSLGETAIVYPIEEEEISFEESTVLDAEFLDYQHSVHPCFRLELHIHNNHVKIKESKAELVSVFMRYIDKMITCFNQFVRPEFASLAQIDRETLEKEEEEERKNERLFMAMKRAVPREYTNIKKPDTKGYRKFMANYRILIKDKDQIEIDQDENLQIYQNPIVEKHLNVADPSEDRFQNVKAMIQDKLIRHYDEAQEVIKIFIQFESLINGTLGAETKKFIENKNNMRLPTYRKKIIELRKIQKLLKKIPNTVFFSMFEIGCEEVKAELVFNIDTLIKSVVGEWENGIKFTGRELCEKFTNIVETLSQSLKTADDVVEMENFHNNLVIEYVRMQEDMSRTFKNMFFLMELDIIIKPEIMKYIEELHIWPLTLNKVKDEAEDRHRQERIELEQKLKIRRDIFESTVTAHAEEIKEIDAYREINFYRKVMDIVTKYEEILNKEEAVMNEILEEEMMLFGYKSNFDTFNNMKANFTPHQEMWKAIYDFRYRKNEWFSGRLENIDHDEVNALINQNIRTISRVQKMFPKKSFALKIVQEFKTEVQKLNSHLPLIEVLCNPALKERHWEQIQIVMNHEFEFREITFNLVVQFGAMDYLEKLGDISERALKEWSLEKQLNKMNDEWKVMEFGLSEWRETGIPILHGAELEDIQLKLEEHTINAQAIRANPFVKPIESWAVRWEKLLLHIQEVIEVWIKVQSDYLYLEPIFNSEDIVIKLPGEASEFQRIDMLWKEIMSDLEKDKLVTHIERIPNLLEKLNGAHTQLEKIQKRLNDYLEEKRGKFPRFYFLSNEELLEILGETKNARKVQKHLKKCFEGINELEFTEETEIIGMKSSIGEYISLLEPIYPNNYHGNVEEWLIRVEKEMREAVADQLAESIKAYAKTLRRVDWILNWPQQAVIAVSQIYWCLIITKALTTRSLSQLEEYLDICERQLEDIVNMVRGELTDTDRLTLGTLVVIDVHAKDILQELLHKRICSLQAFEWLAQLRYYYRQDDDETGEISVRMMSTQLRYGNEYLGNSERLVITPLTDRCYRTLMAALHLNLGGAPEGPAGTGKTETVKDMAKALAVKCVVFNCSEGLDFKAMAKLFKGLASTGSWSCFDEFNRIHLEVLSVVAQQILTIQTAKTEKKTVFRFDEREIILKDSCNVFITMNPGYAGRTELPDNLKALFRPVAMMVPDYAMIAEISLYSYGFQMARDMARKIVATYKLCSEQLSSQYHYDYGMRAVKSVLTASGGLKRRMPEEKEATVILRSICDVNLPKFLSHDLPLFKGIYSDLFPDTNLLTTEYGVLTECISEIMNKRNLQGVEAFSEKLYQLYEMINCRHGLMIVGPTFGGKSTCYKVLADAITMVSKVTNEVEETKVENYVINPKSITLQQLYGYFDPISHDFTDGILATYFRLCAKRNPGKNRKWIIFDGPVDSKWIENMNTVLDDNRMLCLMNGEIIQMPQKMNLIYEVDDLSQASPATISRCGMVYMQPEALGWLPILQSWIRTLPDTIDQSLFIRIKNLFLVLLSPSFVYVSKKCKMYLKVSEIHMAVSLMKLFYCFLSDEEFLDFSKNPRVKQEDIVNKVDQYFLYSLCWSVGVILDSPGKRMFSLYLRKQCNDSFQLEQKNKFLRVDKMAQFPDSAQNIHNYFLEGGRWKSWKDVLEKLDRDRLKTIADADEKIHEIVVPTTETLKYEYTIDLLVKNKISPLLIGPTGTGKSVYIGNYIKSLPQNKFTSIFISFSAQTSANQTQDIIDSSLSRRGKRTFGPSFGLNCLIFVDDLNMPRVEEYGAQPPIELLRQYMDHKGWYNRREKDKPFRELVDVLFIGAMGPPGGGKNDVTSRYLRHFNMMTINPFEEVVMVRIFGTLMDVFVKRGGFPLDLSRVLQSCATATISIYQEILAELLPTPAKSHYLFNMRDPARVIQGIMMINNYSLNPRKLVRLWVHEINRVFFDRLNQDKDAAWVYKGLFKVCREKIKEDLKIALGEVLPPDVDVNSHECLRHVVFSDVLGDGIGTYDRPYAESSELPLLQEKMNAFLEEYNSLSKKPMALVMFQFAVDHVLRTCRILRMSRGNALLIGVGGSGRQSVTKLSTFVCDFNIFEIEVTKNYNLDIWHEQIKNLLTHTALENKNYVFLLSDSQIKFDFILEDINNLLNSGEVPNLWALDEKVEIEEKLRPIAKKEQRMNLFSNGTSEQYIDFFKEKVKDNLHTVLAMSPIGTALRSNIRMFPSLVNCCTIDYFSQWPQDALEAVAENFLKEVEMKSTELKAVINICKDMHQYLRNLSEVYLTQEKRHNYVTPTSYLELIMTYKHLLNLRREITMGLKIGYDKGIDKLEFTAGEVDTLQNHLVEQEPILQQMTVEAEALLEKIQVEKEEVVEPKKKEIQKEEAIANEHAQEAEGIKNECKQELSKCEPILREAIHALETITAQDIIILKSFGKPPAPVKLVMMGVCIMCAIKTDKIPKDATMKEKEDIYWEAGKKFISQPHFIDEYIKQQFDKDHIPEGIMTKIRKEFVTHKDFNPARVAKASNVAKGLCMWILALNEYDKVIKFVNPKREKAAKADAEYKATMEVLITKRNQLREVIEKLDTLQHKLDETILKKKNLDAEIEDTRVKIVRATQLLSGLGGEKQRWEDESERLGKVYENLPGDMLIASGICAYLGAFTSKYREATIQRWIGEISETELMVSESLSLEKSLGEPVTIRKWILNGLPTDSFSKENAILCYTSRRWPLMIDPQSQANKWIKNLENPNNLSVLKLSDMDFMRNIKRCIQFGQPALIENIREEMDVSLQSLLEKQTFKNAGMLSIKLGDEIIDYDKDFQLYITTKLSNPHYLPELSTKVIVINFMITYSGLRDQLLDLVVQKEKPALEEQRSKLILQRYENRKQMKDCEDRILETLKKTEGNILSDESAISVLNESQELSKAAQEKEIEAKVTEKSIKESREEYEAMAHHSSLLFFIIAGLSNIEVMYQYSLSWYIQLCSQSIDHAEQADFVDQRVELLIDHFTKELYENISRSLFEKDKLLFSFLLTVTIAESRNELTQLEYKFLISTLSGLENPTAANNPATMWLSQSIWNNLCVLSQLKSDFLPIISEFKTYKTEWKKFFESPQPCKEELPGKLAELTIFQKLLIIKVLRPDKVVQGMRNYIIGNLGQSFIDPPHFNLERSFNDSINSTPLIFVLPGTDPMAALTKFAQLKRKLDSMQKISLGEGQGPIAERAIEEAKKGGFWVLLQNCHLAPSWMSTLQRICEGLESKQGAGKEQIHPSFRLWLTSYPSKEFPVSILQRGIKMTNEPPKGFKANLLSSYTTDPMSDPHFFESHPHSKIFKRLLYGLCCFHAIVQERRSFGGIGWNIPYEFNQSDLRISVRQLALFLQDYEQLPFKALKYMIGECNYGGRVTDDRDRRVLHSLIETFFNTQFLNLKEFESNIMGLNTLAVPIPDIPYESYLKFLDTIGTEQHPGLFGFHSNANISLNLKETNETLNSLLEIGDSVFQSSKGKSQGIGAIHAKGKQVVKSEDLRVEELANEILSLIPAEFDIESAQNKYLSSFEQSYSNSMNTVLVQELIRFNGLTTVIRSSLKSILLAMKGEESMSQQLEMVSGSMLVAKIPSMWMFHSYPSLKPLASYINDLKQRLGFFKAWVEDGPPPIFWLSGFYFTQSFLTGTLQNFARKQKYEIDILKFEFKFLDSDPTDYGKEILNQKTCKYPAPQEGALISGLHLEGCRWDYEKGVLEESFPKELFTHAPIIWLIPALVSEERELDTERSAPPEGVVEDGYECPVYKTTERKGILLTTGHSTNYIFSIRIPTQHPSYHWVKRGVALICQLDT